MLLGGFETKLQVFIFNIIMIMLWDNKSIIIIVIIIDNI